MFNISPIAGDFMQMFIATFCFLATAFVLFLACWAVVYGYDAYRKAQRLENSVRVLTTHIVALFKCVVSQSNLSLAHTKLSGAITRLVLDLSIFSDFPNDKDKALEWQKRIDKEFDPDFLNSINKILDEIEELTTNVGANADESQATPEN